MALRGKEEQGSEWTFVERRKARLNGYCGDVFHVKLIGARSVPQSREVKVNLTEQQLISGLRRGELSALEELMDRYTPYVSSVIARILRGRQADVEDLTADVFLAVWDNREKVQPGKVKGYLGAIARNRAFNLLRADQESLPLEEDVLLLETDGPDKELDRRETARMVNQALGELDKPQRELFVRHYYYGQTVQEAALAMGLNLSTAKTWLRRGRETLKAILEKEGYGHEAAGDFRANG